jgi:hypothetical protein
MAGAVLALSILKADPCRKAIRAFVCPMGRIVHAVQARLTNADGVVFASEMWSVGTRELSGIAEEVARWIVAESGEQRDLEATVTVWDRRLGGLH